MSSELDIGDVEKESFNSEITSKSKSNKKSSSSSSDDSEGNSKEIEDAISANFKLSDNDKKLILSSNGKIIDEVDVVKLEKNMSYGRKDDKWLYFYSPTPGKENITHGREKLEKDGDT